MSALTYLRYKTTKKHKNGEDSFYIVFHNFKYNWKRINADKSESWWCREVDEKFPDKKCSATLNTIPVEKGMQVQKINNRKVFKEDSANIVELISSLHNHKPNMDEVQQAVVDSLATMQLRASTENLTPGDIYRQEQAKLTVKLGSTELAASLPELTQISTTLYNRKHEKNIIFSVFIFISMRIYVHI
jgi:hypothetical protein